MKQRIYLATKFIIPTASKEVILVKGFLDKITSGEKLPLTLIKAGAGYGKSSLLGLYLKNSTKKFYWFNVTGDDNELYNFIYDLVYAVRIHREAFGENILNLLEQTEKLQNNWRHILNLYITSLWQVHKEISEDIYLVIEDFQRVQDQHDIVEVMNYLLDNLPPAIHLIMTARSLPATFHWQQWKVRGKAVVITEDDLAFDREEIRHFFVLRAGIKLEPKELELIADKTEGWAIALEMLIESFDVEKIKNLDEELSDNAQDLFSFLASDVLDKQEEATRQFLISSSVLDFLNEDVCRYLFGDGGSISLQQVIHKGLFIHEYTKANYRFHSLFRDFLYHVARKEDYPLRQLHIKAAKFFLEAEHYEEGINHLIKAGEYGQAATYIVRVSPEMLKGARFNTLQFWLKRIPEDICNLNPWLYVILGDIHRHTNNFHQAIYYYEKAEKLKFHNSFIIEVLKRKALVYIETVQPSLAEPLLNQVLELIEDLDEKEKESLLESIAENDLNLGKIDEVIEIQEKARNWKVELPHSLNARLMLRTGRIQEAVDYLEQRFKDDSKREVVPPKGHREIWLILSLLYSSLGKDSYTAYSYAKHGLELGQNVGSPFTESVGASRIGHNLLIRGRVDEAISWYQRAAQLNDDLTLPRGKGEPLWGLCMAYGLKGQLAEALRCGEEGKLVCLEARDKWMTCLLIISESMACYNAENYAQALKFSQEGKQIAEQCRDTFLYTVALLWESLSYWKTKEHEQLVQAGTELFAQISKYDYTFLMTKRTLWTPKDKGQLQAFLWAFSDLCGKNSQEILHLLPYLSGRKPDYHPGYSLYFNTLGGFRVWRGDEEVKDEEWTRDKARKLLMILLVYRGKFVRSEQLIDMLWPDKSQEQGKQNLKVTINTLHKILEPVRQGHQPFFVERNNFGYGLINIESIIVDADEFSDLVQIGQRYRTSRYRLAQDVLESAIQLYKGEFMPEAAYEDWVISERERLRKLFLETGENVALMHLQAKHWDKCLETCERIISYDSCREEAYRVMITCYLQMKQKTLAVQAYHRCKNNLARHLAIKPSRELFTLIKSNIAGM